MNNQLLIDAINWIDSRLNNSNFELSFIYEVVKTLFSRKLTKSEIGILYSYIELNS